jgi:hypothetical protein
LTHLINHQRINNFGGENKSQKNKSWNSLSLLDSVEEQIDALINNMKN